MTYMKFYLTLFLILLSTICFCQFKNSVGAAYTFSFQVDSSEYFIIGGQPRKAERSKYIFENNNNGYDVYNGQISLWTNALIYNTKTKQLKNIIDMPLVGVYPMYNVMELVKYDYTFYQRGMISGITKDNIVYLVKTDTYNKDGVIDVDDPVYIFVSKKDGSNCKQITPNGMNVTGWRVSRDGLTIIATIQPDLNIDKKFSEDEVLYQIDLNEDISKIKLTPATASK